MKRIILISSLLIFFLWPALGAARSCSNINGKNYCHVPLIASLADPERFDGQHVLVTGFLKIEPNINALFLTKDHADIHDYTHGIDLLFHPDSSLEIYSHPQWKEIVANLVTPDKAKDKFVLTIGIFNAKKSGDRGRFYGQLSEVKGFRIKPVEK